MIKKIIKMITKLYCYKYKVSNPLYSDCMSSVVYMKEFFEKQGFEIIDTHYCPDNIGNHIVTIYYR